MNTQPLQPRCAGTNKLGYACKNASLIGSDYCVVHDPSRQDIVIASTAVASDALATTRRNKRLTRVEDMDDVIYVLKTSLQNLARKATLTTKETANVSSLSNTLMRALEKKKLFERIDHVESRLKSLAE